MRFARLLLFLLARFWRWDSGLPHGGMIPPWSAAESQTKEECELFSFARAKHCRGESEPDAAVDNVRKISGSLPPPEEPRTRWRKVPKDGLICRLRAFYHRSRDSL